MCHRSSVKSEPVVETLSRHTRGGGQFEDRIVKVVQGDITTERVDVVVNAANEYLRHGGGVAAALAAVGGEEFVADSDRWVAQHGPVPSGEAAVTAGGRLQATWVVHVVGPRYRQGQDNPALLRDAVRAALDASAGTADAFRLGLDRAIGAGRPAGSDST